MNDLEGKRALITGGTSTIGRATAEALAREGAHVVITFVRVDLASADEVRALAERVADIDILVNNASVEPAFDEDFAVTVKAPFLLTAAIAPRMAARGHGSIINVATMAGQPADGGSKDASALLTKALAAEYGPKGIRVNAVSLGGAADPDEIAETIVFLASDRASYMNGAVIPVSGGRVAA